MAVVDIKLRIEEGYTTRAVVGGVAVTVRTAVTVATPASITREQLEELVQAVAVKDEDGNWITNMHEVLGSIDAGSPDIEDLFPEAAQSLNDDGVSISDWPPYRIEAD